MNVSITVLFVALGITIFILGYTKGRENHAGIPLRIRRWRRGQRFQIISDLRILADNRVYQVRFETDLVPRLIYFEKKVSLKHGAWYVLKIGEDTPTEVGISGVSMTPIPKSIKD